MTRKADIFDVWGAPPKTLTANLSQRQVGALKRYVEATTDKVYRLGYDNGTEAGLSEVTSTARTILSKRKRFL